MTWTLKLRGSTDRPIAAEYLCPVHGRFTRDVQRDANGDPPAELPCPDRLTVVDSCALYATPRHGGSVCGLTSPYVISAPARVKVRLVEAAVRGKSEKPEFKTWTNTDNLAEGQDLEDWRADRAKVWEEQAWKDAKEIARDL